jgi:hypothetical protein
VSETVAIYRKRIRRSLEGCTFKPSLRLCLFNETGYCLDLFGFLIALPFLDRFAYEPHEMMESWGVYLNGVEAQWRFDSIVFCWGNHTKFVYMPWEFTHIKSEVRRADGTWAKRVQSYEAGEPDNREVLTFPYRHVCRSGTVQETTATVYVERMEWRRKWTKRLPWFAKVRQSIYVQFADELGDAAGSWKGGCIGCGWNMLPGETAEQTLRRMESERTFR